MIGIQEIQSQLNYEENLILNMITLTAIGPLYQNITCISAYHCALPFSIRPPLHTAFQYQPFIAHCLSVSAFNCTLPFSINLPLHTTFQYQSTLAHCLSVSAYHCTQPFSISLSLHTAFQYQRPELKIEKSLNINSSYTPRPILFKLHRNVA